MEKTRLHPVSIVGTGAGYPQLLTVMALESIQTADVLVYDNMSAFFVFGQRNVGAEVIYLNKGMVTSFFYCIGKHVKATLANRKNNVRKPLEQLAKAG